MLLPNRGAILSNLYNRRPSLLLLAPVDAGMSSSDIVNVTSTLIRESNPPTSSFHNVLCVVIEDDKKEKQEGSRYAYIGLESQIWGLDLQWVELDLAGDEKIAFF